MDVKLIQKLDSKEVEVLIQYAQMNQTVRRLESLVKSFDKTLRCERERSEIWVPASDIYYAESVDKRTFVYCEKEVYRSDLRLYQVLEELSGFGFVQVNKACVLNINVLEQIRPLLNSRLEATLINGERVNVTRKYVAAVKDKLLERGSR